MPATKPTRMTCLVDLAPWILEPPQETPPKEMIVRDIEFLRANTYNGQPLDERIVQECARNNAYLETQCKFEPPLVRGHDFEQRTDLATEGYVKNWRLSSDGALTADVEVLDEWLWDRIQRRLTRYLSCEMVYATADPLRGGNLGASISAVGTVDVPAHRMASLFGEGQRPINLQEMIEAGDGEGVAGKPAPTSVTNVSATTVVDGEPMAPDNNSPEEKTMTLMEKIRAKFGLGAEATEEDIAAKVDALKLDETADPEKPPATMAQDAPDIGMRLANAEQELAERKQRDAERDKRDEEREQATYGEKVALRLADLRKSGQLPPVVEGKLAVALAAVPHGQVLTLGEGEKQTTVTYADAVLEALSDLPRIARPEAYSDEAISGGKGDDGMVKAMVAAGNDTVVE